MDVFLHFHSIAFAEDHVMRSKTQEKQLNSSLFLTLDQTMQ